MENNINKDDEVYALWEKAVPILSEMMEEEDIDEEREESLWNAISDIVDLMEEEDVGNECRRDILRKAFPYFETDCFGRFEPLFDLLLSSCNDKESFDLLREMLEKLGNPLEKWISSSHFANLIELFEEGEEPSNRPKELRYAVDFLELARRHRDEGNWEEAMSVAERGLATAAGSLLDLRAFIIERMDATGERSRAIALRFDQFAEGHSLDYFADFISACSEEELAAYEEKIAETLKKAPPGNQLPFFMYRRKFKNALRVFQLHGRTMFWGDDEFEVAEELEEHFPQQMHKCYMESMGNLYVTASRMQYDRKGRMMAGVRRILTERLRDEKKWLEFARTVKKRNARRPELQDEFSRLVPGWEEL